MILLLRLSYHSGPSDIYSLSLHDALPILQRLEQHGIPASFSWSQLDAFLLQGHEQGANRNDWNVRFFRHVKSQWVFARNDAARQQQRLQGTFNPQQEDALPIRHDWQPHEDALQILQRAEIGRAHV